MRAIVNRFKSDLNRQFKALNLLYDLLQEEYFGLTQNNTNALASKELSIQELLRQLASERSHLAQLVQTAFPSCKTLSEALQEMPQEKAKPIADKLQHLQQMEQTCSSQATVNADLAVALVQQSQNLMNFMHVQIKPKQKNTYSRYGRLGETQAQPILIQGKM